MDKKFDNKMVFEKPELEIIYFSAEDIIVTSSQGPTPQFPGGDDWTPWW